MEQFKRTLYDKSKAFRWFDAKQATATGWIGKLVNMKTKAVVNQLSDAQLVTGPYQVPAS